MHEQRRSTLRSERKAAHQLLQPISRQANYVGISGHQHLAGVNHSKMIVAISKEEESPDLWWRIYGLVGTCSKRCLSLRMVVARLYTP